MVVRERYPDAAFTHPNPAVVAEVLQRLPELCQRVFRVAADDEFVGQWRPYTFFERRAGLQPRQFHSALGGYRSHDPERPRPFHIGQGLRSGEWFLMVDDEQAAALTVL
jgi:hypothetical protein